MDETAGTVEHLSDDRPPAAGGPLEGPSMRRLALVPLVAALVGISACSGSGTSTPAASTGGGAASAAASGGGGGAAACATAPAGAAAAVTVTIKDLKFSPQPVQAKVGDVIAWTNQDGSIPHTATLDNGACDTKTIAGGATAMLVFNTAGTYPYHCTVHPAMKDYSIVIQ
jgi:plastocyanin